jgi:uncharacterized protein
MTSSRRRSPRTVPVFIDTSAFQAFADTRDDDHVQASEIFDALAVRRSPLHTTNLIIAETHVLLKARLAYYVAKPHALTVARQAIEAVYQSSVLIDPVTSADERASLALLARYADQDFSFTDATSFVVMRRLGISHAFSFDSDYVTAGFTDIRHSL